MESLLNKAFKEGMNYAEYTKFCAGLAERGESTWPEPSEDMVNYTRINWQRMKRLNKTTIISEDLKVLLGKLHPMNWVVITEPWCGDAAQNVPIIAAAAEINKSIELKLVLRDKNPELIDQFLTNGSRSIPKLIVFRENEEPMAVWGPRPAEVQKLVMDYKALPEPKIPYKEFSIEVQNWYNKNRSQAMQRELKEILDPLIK